MTQQASGATLEELGLKTAQQEKVLVRRAGDVELSPKLQGRSVAEADAYRGIKPGLKGNELREAIRNRNIAEAASTAKVEPKAVVGGRDLNRRANENITTEEGRNNWRARKAAEMQEGSLSRSLQETSRTAPTGRNLVPVKGAVEATASKPWYSRAWESTKSGMSKAWEGTKSLGKSAGNKISGAWESAKGLGSSAWGKVSKGAERVGNWSANTRVGRAVVGATESPAARRISSVASKVANSGAVKWGGRALGALGVGVDVYNRKKEGQTWGKVGAGVGSGLAGAALGAKGGAALGGAIGSAFFGVGAVPGAAIGGFLGGVGGYFAGSGAGDWVYDKVMGTAEPVKPGDKPKPVVATANGARQAPAAALQQRPRASVQGGQNQDSAIISRSTAAVATAKGAAEKPVINVPPPTVIQAPPQQSGPTIPHTSPHSRPDDNSWLTWQRRRTAAA